MNIQGVQFANFTDGFVSPLIAHVPADLLSVGDEFVGCIPGSGRGRFRSARLVMERSGPSMSPQNGPEFRLTAGWRERPLPHVLARQARDLGLWICLEHSVAYGTLWSITLVQPALGIVRPGTLVLTMDPSGDGGVVLCKATAYRDGVRWQPLERYYPEHDSPDYRMRWLRESWRRRLPALPVKPGARVPTMAELIGRGLQRVAQ